jgi:O-antigen biosynthesis protein
VKASSISLRVQRILRRLPEKLDRFLPVLGQFRPHPSHCTELIHCLYQAALGRLADDQALAQCTARLRAGDSMTVLAAGLVRSEEFRKRHGETAQVTKEFVHRLYQDALGRSPDPEGLQHWLEAPARGVNLGALVASLATSEECVARHRRKLIQSLYQTAFGRFPDENRLVNALQGGETLEKLATSIVSSPEFESLRGLNGELTPEYVKSLYKNGLGREPGQSEMQAWFAENGASLDRERAIVAVATSSEALAQIEKLRQREDNARPLPLQDIPMLVHSFYKTAFGRLADPRALASGVQQIEAGMSPERFADVLVHSAEFVKVHGVHRRIDTQRILSIYANALDRLPEATSLCFWLSEARRGVSIATLITSVASSAEALSRVYHGRDLDPVTRYQRWIAANDTIRDDERSIIHRHLAGFAYRPLISVILLTGGSPKDISKSIRSVTDQLYPYWELWITASRKGEGSTVRDLSADFDDIRIRSRFPEGYDESSTETTNRCLDLATGEFVCFLAPGDLLAENAFYEAVYSLGKQQSADFIYSDCDEITEQGVRTNPWFKAGWDPDLLLAQYYINGLAVFRRSLVQALGGVRGEFEGAELYDLVLRVAAATVADQILHIPAILYHRVQQQNGSDSRNGLEQLKTSDARRRAVRHHLDSCGYEDAAIQSAPNASAGHRIVWPIPEVLPLVSIIIPTRDRVDLLELCLDGVLNRTDYRQLEVLIMDNESREAGTAAFFERMRARDGRVNIIECPGPFNYSALNNLGARRSSGEVLLLLNNDVVAIEPTWLTEVVSQVMRRDVGVVGVKLIYPDERIQHAGVSLGPENQMIHHYLFASRLDPGYFGQLALARTLSAVTGACLAIRKDVFFEVGGLDENNLRVAFNDIDLCLRTGDYGYRIVWTPFAELFHLESASRGLDDRDTEKRARFHQEWRFMRETWGMMLDCHDPFHNPNIRFAGPLTEIPSLPRRRRPWYDQVEASVLEQT